MANIKATGKPTNGRGTAFTYTYANVKGAADSMTPVYVGDLTDLCVQTFGVFTGGGSVTLQGSNDPRVLTDPANAAWQTIGSAISAAALSAVGLVPQYLRIIGTGTVTGVSVVISGKRLT